MFPVFDCIVYEHDLKLVALAAVICVIASFAAINLLHHVTRSRGHMRSAWLCAAGNAAGFGIWATHFIAMLAFSPGMHSGYSIMLTLISLFAAVLLAILSFAVATAPALKFGRRLGGMFAGGTIAVVHYTGMAAFEIPGRIAWNPLWVAASIASGVILGAFALSVGLRARTRKPMAAGMLLFALAICSHHFIGMAAATPIEDPGIAMPPNAIPPFLLATMVTFACAAILLLAFASLVLDVREQHQTRREMERLSSLADAAFEGLLVCEGNVIITANTSLATLLNCSVAELIGRKLSQIIPQADALRWLTEKPCTAFETNMHALEGGEVLEVEVFSRPIVNARKIQTVIAIRDLRDRKKAEKDIYYLAHHDALTGLANRNTFNQKLNQFLEAHQSGGHRAAKYLAVLCLDLDRFKEVNDLFGHAAGDKLLQAVANCASGVLRKGQLMARLGGDEFAILAPGLTAREQAGRIADDLLRAFRDANMLAPTMSAMISTSIGIAVYPGDAHDSTSLMSHADAALYRAKANGRGNYQYFEQEMGEAARDRRRIEHDLRFAIENRELALVYQPLARTADRGIFGFEALLRWHHSERGEIPPGVFIPIAEECGLILQIGEWVLREACMEAATWHKPLSLAVNVSTAQLHSSSFVEHMRETLAKTGLKPGRLELEITETAVIRDPDRALATVCQLKEMGVRIAMDDFGTGYSSLSNLREFPFDKIKIDGSFIRFVNLNEPAAAIVRAILDLGRGLDLPVIAEGVETEEELAFLRAESCHEAQGYLLGRPQPIDYFRRFLME
jgi:diguanylate cyclase (GGDEF)-like protein